MFYCVTTNRPRTEKYIESFSRGANANITDYKTVIDSKDCDKVCFMGVLRGTNLVYKWAEKNKKDFYYIDRPYWGESRGTPYWMRCVKNEHVKTKHEQRPDDRYKKHYKGDAIRPYHKNGKYVLVVPPSHSMALHFDAPNWLDDTLQILKHNTDREIIIREKPYNPKSFYDGEGKLMPGPSDNKQPEKPFEWDQVHAVVTFNSSITIKALHNGVPCFSNFENPCGEICESDFSKIETPMYADREPVFHSLAYGQFTQEEFRNGWALSILDGR
jgi:hypothetical protein|tara:strand:+ start:1329 stop:2144 length:816 start_codon:yes stop_codon:yes gene_type:complete